MSKNISFVSSWRLFSSLVITSVMALGILSPLAAGAQNVTDALNGLNTTANKIGAFQDQTNENIDSSFLATKTGQIIGLVLSFIGVLFLGLMIYAGIMWMTAGGNEQTITKAKDLLVNAAIGIVIVFAAYAITVFLGNQFVK